MLAARARPHLPGLIAAAAGLAWFLLHVGPGVANPGNVAWLLGGDWGANYLGWAFFRHAPIGLPLGANAIYPAPVGSTLGFTDSIPIVGLLLRPIAPVLPADFQYVGPWLAASFALQGFLGAKLVKLATPSAVAQALGGALFALAPPLLHRVVGPNTGHASLAAHWLVLAGIWLAVAPVGVRLRPRLLAGAGLLVAAAGTHPYHVVMTAAAAAALALRLWRVDRRLDAARAGALLLGTAALAALSLAAFGYLSAGVATAAPGYGFYSADALSLAAPMGWSRLWTGPRLGHGQYEGFGYLGVGVLVAAIAAAASLAARRSALPDTGWRRAIPCAASALLLAALAASTRLTVAGTPVIDLEPAGPLASFAATFRSTGRFIWPLHYLVVLGAVAGLAVAWQDRPRLLVGALAAALALQAIDVRPPVPLRTAADRWVDPGSDAWASASGAYRHVALYPPYLLAGGAPVAPSSCGGVTWPLDGHLPAAAVAWRLGASFNSGYAARLDPNAAARGCDALRISVAEGRLDPATIYVVQPSVRTPFDRAGAVCGTIDGMLACVSGDRRDPFSAALRRAGGG